MKLKSLVKIFSLEIAYAHCDIPCGIYDVQTLQMAAHTVLRMTQLIGQITNEEPKRTHDMTRVTHVKEEHGAIVEDEIGTLDVDYFKPEHYKEFPELKDVLSSTAKLSVVCRQKIDTESAQKLLLQTQQIAEIFYKTKKLEPIRVPSGYPTEGELVMHK